ncbi:hypothetical protein GOP47_0022110, partial [Adiantum capillus-veneris]
MGSHLAPLSLGFLFFALPCSSGLLSQTSPPSLQSLGCLHATPPPLQRSPEPASASPLTIPASPFLHGMAPPPYVFSPGPLSMASSPSHARGDPPPVTFYSHARGGPPLQLMVPSLHANRRPLSACKPFGD